MMLNAVIRVFLSKMYLFTKLDIANDGTIAKDQPIEESVTLYRNSLYKERTRYLGHTVSQFEEGEFVVSIIEKNQNYATLQGILKSVQQDHNEKKSNVQSIYLSFFSVGSRN